MSIARTVVADNGPTSVPDDVLQKLGVSPGSVLEWDVDGDQIVLRRARTYSSLEIHKMLFPDGPPKPLSVEEMDEAIANYMIERHASGRY